MIGARRTALLFTLILLFAIGSSADALSFTGSLDPNNPNDVFFTAFSLGAPATVNIQTWGYGGTGGAPGGTNAAGMVIPAGGFDPCLSLFTGTGDAATFLVSNDDGLCPPGNPSPACHDSTIGLIGLTAGSYTLALTVFDNFSFAENFGSGTLGDGFIGLGNYFDSASGTVRSSNYAVDITSTGHLVLLPEPGSFVVLGCSLLAMAWKFRKDRKFP